MLQLCVQTAYVFVPVGTGLATLLSTLVKYVKTRAGAHLDVPLADSPLASSFAATPLAELDADDFTGSAAEYIALQLPARIFDYMKCLLKLGEAMDQVAEVYDMPDMLAHHSLKQQV